MTDAEKWIEILTGNKDTKMHFRGIYEKNRDSVHKAMNVYGSLKDHEPALRAWNAPGHDLGIFATVNLLNSTGRTAADIRAIRSFFIDLDGGTTWDDVRGPDYVEPSVVVKTKNGNHVFWCLKEPDEQVEYFSAIELGLIEKYGADPACKDASRVLRVPGFFHNKSDPFLISIKESSGIKYTMDDLIVRWKFNLIELQSKIGVSPENSKEVLVPNLTPDLSYEDYHLAMGYVKNKWCKNKLYDGRKNACFTLCAALLRGWLCSQKQTFALVKMWSNDCCVPPLSDAIIKQKMANVIHTTEPLGQRLENEKKYSEISDLEKKIKE